MGKYFIPGSRRNFNRILVNFLGMGVQTPPGILGKYHICSAESSCIDGTSVGVVPTGICIILVVVGILILSEKVYEMPLIQKQNRASIYQKI